MTQALKLKESLFPNDNGLLKIEYQINTRQRKSKQKIKITFTVRFEVLIISFLFALLNVTTYSNFKIIVLHSFELVYCNCPLDQLF